MQLTLHHFNNSVCSEKVRMVLNEKSLSWESREVDLFRGEQFRPDYLKLNPKAVVPTLVHGDKVLTESTLIAEYLDEAFSQPRLSPEAPWDRAQMRLYSKMCDEGLHQGVAVLSYAAMFMDRLRAMTPEQLKVHLDKIVDLERRDRQTSIYQSGVEAPQVYRGVVAFEKAFQKINKVLADGRSWLAGDRFSLAEINLAPYFARLEYMSLLDVWTGDRPLVTQWFTRIKDRPSFRTEVISWIREAEWSEMRTAGTRIRPRVAEFRENYLETDSGAQIY